MNEIIKKLPIPIAGLMLALVACGNLVLSYGSIYRNIFGILSSIILLLLLIKIVKYPNKVRESLSNPVVSSVFPTLSMGIMLLSTYVKAFSNYLGFAMWILGLVLHMILIINFTRKFIFNFNIKNVFPSWFIVYVGIVVASVTGPAFGMESLGQALFWFGLISYFILLPIVIKRVFLVKEIPEPALPTIAIFAAPVALCLAGYMSSFQEKNMIIVWLLLIISQVSFFSVLLYLPRLLKLKFSPSYSGLTFPLVISGISLKLTNGFLINIDNSIPILKFLVKFEEIMAILITLYVLIRYINFLTLKDKTTN